MVHLAQHPVSHWAQPDVSGMPHTQDVRAVPLDMEVPFLTILTNKSRPDQTQSPFGLVSHLTQAGHEGSSHFPLLPPFLASWYLERDSGCTLKKKTHNTQFL